MIRLLRDFAIATAAGTIFSENSLPSRATTRLVIFAGALELSDRAR
jgi:hypothetical protein